MLDMVEEGQVDRTSYPTEGVRVGINYHEQTLGKHRPRFSFDRPVVEVLRRGLSFPRAQVDGSFVNGLRVWCTESDGMAPNVSSSGGWSFSVPVRRLRGREEHVPSTAVEFTWERDETGPVLIIPRLPDAMLPEAVVDKLPNGAVDPVTRNERAEKRLRRVLAGLKEQGDETVRTTEQRVAEVNGTIGSHPPRLEAVLAEIGAAGPPAGESGPMGEPTHPADRAALANAPNAHHRDLKEALAMVNELVDQLGDDVVLGIDANGHVVARRRVVQFIDL